MTLAIIIVKEACDFFKTHRLCDNHAFGFFISKVGEFCHQPNCLMSFGLIK